MRDWLAQIGYLSFSAIATMLAFRVARAAYLPAPIRRSWLFFGSAFLAGWLGNVIWLIYTKALHQEPAASWADLGWLAFYPLTLIGLLLLPTAPRQRAEKVAFWLDASAVLVSGSMLIWFFSVLPRASAGMDNPWLTALTLAYPVGDLIVLFGGVRIALRSDNWRNALPMHVFSLGLLAFLAADLGYSSMMMSETYQDGMWPSSLWIVAYAIFAIASQLQRDNQAATIVEQQRLGFHLGASAYLVKPIDEMQLRTTVAQLSSLMMTTIRSKSSKPVSIGQDHTGCTRRTAAHRAGRRLSSSDPILIILDLMMPEIDGFTILKRLESDPYTRHIPVVVLSAKDLTTRERAYLAQRVKALLAKGETTPERLLHRVMELLNARNAMDVSSTAHNPHCSAHCQCAAAGRGARPRRRVRWFHWQTDRFRPFPAADQIVAGRRRGLAAALTLRGLTTESHGQDIAHYALWYNKPRNVHGIDRKMLCLCVSLTETCCDGGAECVRS